MKDKIYFLIQILIYLFSVFIGGLLIFGMCFVWLIFSVIVLVVDFFETFSKKKMHDKVGHVIVQK